MNIKNLIATLGNKEVTGFRLQSNFDIVDAIRSGLRSSVIDYIIQQQTLTRQEVEHLIIPRSTLALRKKRNLPLTTLESEHTIRIIRIIAQAKETFANPTKAAAWLRRPNRVLQNRIPLALLDTEEGARIVENLLGQIAHGLLN